MSTRAQLSAQIQGAQSQKSAAQAQLATVNAQITEVQAARKKIKELKERAEDQKVSLDKFDCTDTGFWHGARYKESEGNYSQSKKEAKTYYNGLDDLADDLVHKERKLLNERDSLNGTLNWVESTIRWLISILDAATN